MRETQQDTLDIDEEYLQQLNYDTTLSGIDQKEFFSSINDTAVKETLKHKVIEDTAPPKEKMEKSTCEGCAMHAKHLIQVQDLANDKLAFTLTVQEYTEHKLKNEKLEQENAELKSQNKELIEESENRIIKFSKLHWIFPVSFVIIYTLTMGIEQFSDKGFLNSHEYIYFFYKILITFMPLLVLLFGEQSAKLLYNMFNSWKNK